MPREGLEVDPKDVVWEGRIGGTPLRVSVPHAERIVAEWDSQGSARHKVASSMEEFERSVLFQLLISAEAGDESATKDVVAAVAKAQSERPPPTPDPSAQRRRKTPKVRQHRRSRTPPRRR